MGGPKERREQVRQIGVGDAASPVFYLHADRLLLTVKSNPDRGSAGEWHQISLVSVLVTIIRLTLTTHLLLGRFPLPIAYQFTIAILH